MQERFPETKMSSYTEYQDTSYTETQKKNQPPHEQPVAACLLWGPFAVQTAARSPCALEAKSRWQSEGSKGHVSDCKREGPAELPCQKCLWRLGSFWWTHKEAVLVLDDVNYADTPLWTSCILALL